MKTQWQKEIEKLHTLEVNTIQLDGKAKHLSLAETKMKVLQQVICGAVAMAFVLSFFL